MVNNWNNNRYLVGGDWNLFYDSPETVGKFIIQTDELTPSFFRGVGIPPTSYYEVVRYNMFVVAPLSN